MKRLQLAILALGFVVNLQGQNRSVSIDADPFLLYMGNLVDGSSVSPVWQGPESLDRGIDVGRYRVEKDDWIRYRLSLLYRNSSDRHMRLMLDNDLLGVQGRFIEDVDQRISLMSSIAVELEKRIGKKSLQGLLGRGLGVQVQRQFDQSTVSNPLEAYLGDTLWRETGYQFAALFYVHTGVQYNLTSSLALSARMNYGISIGHSPLAEYRQVVQQGTGVVLESFSEEKGSTSMSLGFYMRPRLMLSLFF